MSELPSDRLAFSVNELAKALGTSHVSIYAALNSGQLRSFQLGRRRLISREAALDFIRAREAEALKPRERREVTR